MYLKQKRLNILFVTPWYPTANHKYAGIFVREYAKAVKLHHNVVVLHLEAVDSVDSKRRFANLVREDSQDLTEGIPTYRLYYSGIVFNHGASIILPIAMLKGIRYLTNIFGRIDMIHAHVFTCGFFAAIVAKICGIPIVISEHWTGFPLRKLSRWEVIEAWVAFSLADQVLPVSLPLQKAIENYGLRTKFHVVPNVVNTLLFKPQVLNNNRNAPSRLLFIGSLIDRKGLSFLFEAMARLRSYGRDLVLDVVGMGPELKNYQSLAEGLGLSEKIVFHGSKSKDEVATFFHQTDVFVLPSLCETFSVVTAEALSSGVPALVTRCGGPEDFVNEKSGMIVRPGDAQALADALCSMIDRLECYNRQEISHSAQAHFGYEAVANSLNSVYLKVLKYQ